MKKYYKESILNAYNNLRNSLLAAICHFLGEIKESIPETVNGNEKLKSIQIVFNDRNMVLTKETIITVEHNEDELVSEKKWALEDASLEWLISIYESLSGESVGR